jgi:hypothetical protein
MSWPTEYAWHLDVRTTSIYPLPKMSPDRALAVHRSGFMQNRGYGLSSMHIRRRLVNKPALNATDSVGWHHAHGVGPKENGE